MLANHNVLLLPSVVFSYWAATLDLIEAGLRSTGIGFVRFDGSKSQSRRQTAINEFRGDPQISVMLLTLTCGSAG